MLKRLSKLPLILTYTVSYHKGIFKDFSFRVVTVYFQSFGRFIPIRLVLWPVSYNRKSNEAVDYIMKRLNKEQTC